MDSRVGQPEPFLYMGDGLTSIKQKPKTGFPSILCSQDTGIDSASKRTSPHEALNQPWCRETGATWHSPWQSDGRILQFSGQWLQKHQGGQTKSSYRTGSLYQNDQDRDYQTRQKIWDNKHLPPANTTRKCGGPIPAPICKGREPTTLGAGWS